MDTLRFLRGLLWTGLHHRGCCGLVPLEWTRSAWEPLPPSLSLWLFLLGWFSTLPWFCSLCSPSLLQGSSKRCSQHQEHESFKPGLNDPLGYMQGPSCKIKAFLWPLNLRKAFWERLSAAQTITVSHSSSTKTHPFCLLVNCFRGRSMIIVMGFVWLLLFKDGFFSGVWNLPPNHELVKVQWSTGRLGRFLSHSCRGRRHFSVSAKKMSKNCLWAQHNRRSSF